MPASPYPKRVLLDLHAECNLQCPKCLVYGENQLPELKSTLVGNSVDNKTLGDLADELVDSKPMIGPALWSEPLVNPNFIDHMKILHRRGLPISINTNGLLLSSSISEFLLSIEIDSICISIDATTSETLLKSRGIKTLRRIEQNVLTLLKMRNAIDGIKTRIGVSFTSEKANEHERDEFVQRWIEEADFVRIGKVFDGNTFKDISEDLRTEERQPCPALYTTMAIQASGNVSICCLDAYSQTSVGNINEQSISEIWNGEKLNGIRLQHENNDYSDLDLCRDCQRWKSYDFKEVSMENILIRESAEYTYYNRLDRLHTWGKAISSDLHKA